MDDILRVHGCELCELPRAFVGLVLVCLLLLLLLRLLLCQDLLEMPAVQGDLLLLILVLLLLLGFPLHPLLYFLIPLELLPSPLEDKLALLLCDINLLGAILP